MNKGLIIGVVVAVVVAGSGFYLLSNRDSDKSASEANQSESTEDTSVVAEQASIEDLLTRNASLKCTYNVEDAESTNEGTAYFSGTKDMYGEFTNTIDGTSNTAYVIRNGDTQYVWQKDSKEGFKSDVSASTKATQTEKSEQYDPDQQYEFDCKKWKKDSSLFEVPSDVTFTDFSAQSAEFLEQIQNYQ